MKNRKIIVAAAVLFCALISGLIGMNRSGTYAENRCSQAQANSAPAYAYRLGGASGSSYTCYTIGDRAVNILAYWVCNQAASFVTVDDKTIPSRSRVLKTGQCVQFTRTSKAMFGDTVTITVK